MLVVHYSPDAFEGLNIVEFITIQQQEMGKILVN